MPTHILCHNVDRYLKFFYLQGLETLKHILIEGQGFRGGSDDKMRKMWLRFEIVVARRPPVI